jgi:hypothetical protein
MSGDSLGIFLYGISPKNSTSFRLGFGSPHFEGIGYTRLWERELRVSLEAAQIAQSGQDDNNRIGRHS